MTNKSKFATVVLSIVPGVGHLYLGWQERGLGFMLAFFLSIFFIDWLKTSLFALLLPVIWFFSLFDALQCHAQGEPPAGRALSGWFFEKQRWIGFGLIALGALILFNRAVVPVLEIYFTYRVLRIISSGLLAMVFIAGGIRLAMGKPLTVPEKTAGGRKNAGGPGAAAAAPPDRNSPAGREPGPGEPPASPPVASAGLPTENPTGKSGEQGVL